MKKDYVLGLSEEGFHRVFYTQWGDTSAHHLPLVCVHGLTRNGRDFDGLAAYLSGKGHAVFCPDIVGRGDSDWLHDPQHYTYEQYVADMNVLIARTKAPHINWLGTSMGGLIGMVMAAADHTPIRRLILNDVGAQIPVKALTRLSKYAARDPDFTSLEQAKTYFKTVYTDFGDLDETEWQRITETSVREIAPGKFISKMDHGVKQSSMKSKLAWKAFFHPHKALEGSLFDIDLWHLFRKITCPLLLIHGTHSDLLTPAIIQKMLRIRPDMQILEIPDAGHAPMLQKPWQWETIETFLRDNKS